MSRLSRVEIEAALQRAAAQVIPGGLPGAGAALVEELGLGSAEVLELVAALEDELDRTIPINHLSRVRTGEDLVALVLELESRRAA